MRLTDDSNEVKHEQQELFSPNEYRLIEHKFDLPKGDKKTMSDMEYHFSLGPKGQMLNEHRIYYCIDELGYTVVVFDEDNHIWQTHIAGNNIWNSDPDESVEIGHPKCAPIQKLIKYCVIAVDGLASKFKTNLIIQDPDFRENDLEEW